MALTTGTIEDIKFGDDYGFFTLLDQASGQPEYFILWFGGLASSGPIALYTMLLSLAITQDLSVEVSHDAASAYIRQMRLIAP
jgi:hypothetical protein